MCTVLAQDGSSGLLLSEVRIPRIHYCKRKRKEYDWARIVEHFIREEGCAPLPEKCSAIPAKTVDIYFLSQKITNKTSWLNCVHRTESRIAHTP